MGGLSLKNLPDGKETRRYLSEEFDRLAEKLVPMVREKFNTSAELVVSFRNKESHGDIDILVLSNKDFGDIRKILVNEFGASEIFHNGNLYSFDYENLQIDLIFTPESNFECSKVFFSYNDLGNLMGKIYNCFGLKYGFDGVKYIHRFKNIQGKRKIYITKDMSKAFEFLGLSFDRFKQGFDTIEEVFDYVIDSKYFDTESFYFENLNSINKQRNKKRKNYNYFLEYLKDNNINKINKFHKDKSRYIDEIESFFKFPLSSVINKYNEEEYRNILIAKKFNGKLIMDKFNLTGKDIGRSIEKFKSSIDNYEEFILNNSEEEILKHFMKVNDII